MKTFALPLAVARVATAAARYRASGDLEVHDTERRAPLERESI